VRPVEIRLCHTELFLCFDYLKCCIAITDRTDGLYYITLRLFTSVNINSKLISNIVLKLLKLLNLDFYCFCVQPELMIKFAPELDAALRYLLWHVSIRKPALYCWKHRKMHHVKTVCMSV